MTDKSGARQYHYSPKLWAALTLAAATTACGAISIAHAHGGLNDPGAAVKERCRSQHACLTWRNLKTGSGVEGDSDQGSGVRGYSFYGAGIEGDSSIGPGVYANGDYGYGLYAYGANSYAIYAQGDVQVTGQIYTGGSCKSGCSKTRQQTSFASRTSQPTIDDVGEAVLRNGAAHIALATDFANTIDPRKPYVVLLTPEGDASLYVANRSESGFDVRQIGGGHSSISFAYRIVAKPYGVADERLPFKAVKVYSARTKQQ